MYRLLRKLVYVIQLKTFQQFVKVLLKIKKCHLNASPSNLTFPRLLLSFTWIEEIQYVFRRYVIPTRRSDIHTAQQNDDVVAKLPVIWPPSLCDLTPLDYFLWGYVKLKESVGYRSTYINKPQTIQDLKDET